MRRTLVSIRELKIGHYVELDLKWSEHPFLFNRFKIKSKDQIQILKNIGLTEVPCVLEKSEIAENDSDDSQNNEESKPVVSETGVTTDQKSNAEAQAEAASEKLWQQKQQRIERMKQIREQRQKCEKHYKKSLGAVKNVMKSLGSSPQQAIEEADEVIGGVVETLFDEGEMMIHLMSDKGAYENTYYHSLNVSVLSMLIGKEFGLGPQEIQKLGLGALFHDIGKTRIPSRLFTQKEPLSDAERNLIRFHPKYGADIVGKIPGFPRESAEIIMQHHEYFNGRGYPQFLKGDQISLFTRIVTVANVYDNHCNHNDPQDSMTPAEALAYMFKNQAAFFDPPFLQILIRCLGVYPPGTVVDLSNDMTGVVISINSSDLLHPSVMLYDPAIPREEAVCIDMAQEKEIEIVKAIRPDQLQPKVFQYLNPRTHVNYYFDNTTLKDKKQ